ncbi:Uncharacterized protein Rs2_31327 [Raphanus sativus]|nr:Uncharacterized protein Rs2_31327 [Raphanus sativus]
MIRGQPGVLDKRASTKRSRPEPRSLKKQAAPSSKLQDELEDLDVSSDLKGIVSALQEIREKADEGRMEGRRKKKASPGCESILKDEVAKFEELHHKSMKEKADHLQGLKGQKEKTMISDQERFCTEKYLLNWKTR